MGSSQSISKCESCEKIPFNIKEYNIVIGSGGNGKIIRHDTRDNVVKLLYNAKTCSESKHEFDIHKVIFIQLWKYMKYNASLEEKKINQLYIATPIDFQDHKITKNGDIYSCGYTMSLIHPIKKNGPLYHIILKKEYERLFNKSVGKIYTEEISEKNPSRGFFASSDYITNNILSSLSEEVKGDINNIEDITLRVGFLFSFIIFVCEYNPFDVEYVLCLNNKNVLSVCVLDFGMAHRLNFDVLEISKDIEREKLTTISMNMKNIHDTDLYFPYFFDKGFESFMKGIEYAFDYSVINEKDKRLIENKKFVYNKYVEMIENDID